MKEKSYANVMLTMIPASEKPLPVWRESSPWYPDRFGVRVVDGEGSCELPFWNEEDRANVQAALAAGEEVRTPDERLRVSDVAGRARLLWGYENGVLRQVFVEVVPDAGVAQGLSFAQWMDLRFPKADKFGRKPADEAWRLWLHRLWAEETQPAPVLAPDDDLLMGAVEDNLEGLVEAILERQPQIVVPEGGQRSISQTALGVALENAGAPGHCAGGGERCHRSYRCNDVFSRVSQTDKESPDTWVPRALRIARRLEAAGAVDYSPLLEACRAGRAEEVEAMLRQGFPPNFYVYDYTSALLEAVYAGQEDVCDLLLNHGADPNVVRPFFSAMDDERGLLPLGGHILPLTLAIDKPAIFERLLDAGADPSGWRGGSIEMPAVFSMEYPSRERAEEIFRRVDFASVRGRYGRSGLFFLSAKDLEKCRHLVPGELLDERDETGLTPLLNAIIDGEVKVAKLLLEMGADPALPGVALEKLSHNVGGDLCFDRFNSRVLTPIQAALLTGSLGLVERMVDLGVQAGRYALELKIPAALEREALEALRTRLDEDLAAIGHRCEGLDSPMWFGDDLLHLDVERRLGVLLLRDPEAVARYAEFAKPEDLVRWAEDRGRRPALIEPFRSGQKLEKADCLRLAEEEVEHLREQIEAFAADWEEDARRSTAEADSSEMMRALDRAEQACKEARERIEGRPEGAPPLSAETDDRASGEFDGAAAQARHAAYGEVEVDGFVECLREALRPGTSTDLVKLEAAVRLVAVRQIAESLTKQCRNLRRAL